MEQALVSLEGHGERHSVAPQVGKFCKRQEQDAHDPVEEPFRKEAASKQQAEPSHPLVAGLGEAPGCLKDEAGWRRKGRTGWREEATETRSLGLGKHLKESGTTLGGSSPGRTRQ